jgi:hypothetical protein
VPPECWYHTPDCNILADRSVSTVHMYILQMYFVSVLLQLYMLLLQVEDLTSSVPDVKQLVTEEKVDLLHKIVSSLLVEDRLTSLMCVHKGKVSDPNLTVNVTPLQSYGISCSIVCMQDFGLDIPSFLMGFLGCYLSVISAEF